MSDFGNSGNSDNFEDTDQSTEESFAVEDTVEEPKVNPAWEEMLGKVPEEFHTVLTPTLSEWDKNFQKVQQEYAPFKDFVENNIPVETIQQSLQIRDLLENNPRGVYDFLQSQYNYGAQEAEKPGPPEEEEYNYDEASDVSSHPKFRELSQQVEGFQQYFQQQQQKEIEQNVQREIESEYQKIAETYAGGKLDEQTKIDIARLAMGAGDNNLQNAAKDYFTRFRTPARASDSAPPVMRGTSRVPKGMTPEDIAQISDPDKRIAAIASMMQATIESD